MHFLLYSLLNYKISVSVLFFVFVCMFVCCFLFLFFFFRRKAFYVWQCPVWNFLGKISLLPRRVLASQSTLSWWKTEVIPLVHFWLVSAESEMFLPSMDLISTDVKARYKQGTTFFLVLKYTSVFLNFH